MTHERIKYHTATWTGNSSSTTSVSNVIKKLIYWVAVHFDASITNDCTITLDSGTNAAGDYDTVLYTFDNAAGVTDNFVEFENLVINTVDELNVACNVGANNAYLTICYEGL